MPKSVSDRYIVVVPPLGMYVIEGSEVLRCEHAQRHDAVKTPCSGPDGLVKSAMLGL